MSPFLDDLEEQLRRAAHARADTGDAIGDARRPGHRRGWLRAGLRTLPVVAAVAGTLAVVVVALVFFGHGPQHGSPPASRPPSAGQRLFEGGRPTPQLRRELGYLGAATKHVANSPACQVAQEIGSPPIHGSPGRALLSILGVLRRPATSADRVGPQFGGETNMRLFAGGARRALVAGRVSYYVVPGRQDGTAEFPSDRCFTLQEAALHQILPTIPASLRAPTVALQAQVLGYVRRLKASPPQDVICFVSRSGNSSSDSCGETASQIVHGQLPSDDMGTFSGVVPDGVASVTVRLPASTGRPVRSVTAPVTNNAYVARLAGPAPALSAEPTLVWRSAGGRVLKTITQPSAGTLARLCQRQPIQCVLGYGLTSSGGGSSSSVSSSSSSASGTATAPRAAP